jgi:hypothetical protein
MNSSGLVNLSDKEAKAVARLRTVDECRQFAVNQKDSIQLKRLLRDA